MNEDHVHVIAFHNNKYCDVIYSPANDWWSCWYDGNMIYNRCESKQEALNKLSNYLALNGI